MYFLFILLVYFLKLLEKHKTKHDNMKIIKLLVELKVNYGDHGPI